MSLERLLDDHRRWMKKALVEAERAYRAKEVPVGAVVVFEDQVVGRGANMVEQLKDPTAHAEILAIRQACESLGNERLTNCDLYVTLEPCPMCAAAISFARIRRLYYGADDAKGGAVEHGVRFFGDPSCHHAPDVYSGLAAGNASRMLRDFFAARR